MPYNCACGQRPAADYRTIPGTILLDAARTIRVMRGATLRRVAVIRDGMGADGGGFGSIEQVRALFANAAPIHNVTPELVAALKGMIFTETERIPLSAAITKLMVIHGMDFDAQNPVYKSIYMSLRSDDPKAKMAGMKQLEDRQTPDYA